MAALEIRKWVSHVEEIRHDGGPSAAPPLVKAAVGLVIGNPFAGRHEPEQEHVVACVTTVFGDALRAAVGGGQAWISSATKVGPAGAALDIPLARLAAADIQGGGLR